MNDSNPVTLRKATRADADTIADAVHALARASGESHKSTAIADDFVRHGFSDAPAFYALIAEREGKAVGLSLWYLVFSSFRGEQGVYVSDLYVDGGERGTGLGKRLLKETARLGRAAGATHLRLSVADTNSNARAFYERLGLKHRDDERIYQASDQAFAQLAGD